MIDNLKVWNCWIHTSPSLSQEQQNNNKTCKGSSTFCLVERLSHLENSKICTSNEVNEYILQYWGIWCTDTFTGKLSVKLFTDNLLRKIMITYQMIHNILHNFEILKGSTFLSSKQIMLPLCFSMGINIWIYPVSLKFSWL